MKLKHLQNVTVINYNLFLHETRVMLYQQIPKDFLGGLNRKYLYLMKVFSPRGGSGLL